MAKCDSFHTQLTTIMDIMTKTTLTQIYKLFEEDSSKLRKEMSRVMEENRVLQDRLRHLEIELNIKRQVEKGAHDSTKTYHRPTIEMQMVENHRGVEKENNVTGLNRAPSIDGIFGKEWCADLWKDGVSRGRTSDDFVDEIQCRENEQDQIELLTIKEEESEVDICERSSSHQSTQTKEKGSCVCGRSKASSADGHVPDTVRKEEEEASVSADSTEGCDNLQNSSRVYEEQETDFINLDGTTGNYIMTVPTAPCMGFDLHCVPIEYEYEGGEGEEVVKELIAFEGLSENPSQTAFLETQTYIGEEGEESFNYFDRFDLQAHLQQTPKRKNRFNCKLCRKKYAKYETLKTHMKVHKRETIYQCRVCKSVFPQKNLLRTHKCTGAPPPATAKSSGKNGAARFCCEYCGRAFTTSCNLRVHYAVHTGERPHKCDICGKSFTQKGNLNIHRRIHTGEKPFSCPMCPKTFSQKINLRHHLPLHGKDGTRNLGKRAKENCTHRLDRKAKETKTAN
ncbi:zinc finger protein 235 [Sardina pilchardus]|uniref:zinc finger protein 235 n=1 Tax=Sardina pilchardus TaxID=27697 RepID=UPI002E0DF355